MRNVKQMPVSPVVTVDQVIFVCISPRNEFIHFLLAISGFARRKHREPCRKVVSILMSMRVDKFYERRIIWDKLLTDSNSEAYGHLSYEAIRAVSISLRRSLACE